MDAVVYLMLVNDMIQGLYPEAVSIGEDVSIFILYCGPKVTFTERQQIEILFF